MKKLQFTLCTLLAVTASLNIHAMEPGRTVEPTRKAPSEIAQAHHDTLTPDQQANARKKADAKVKNDTKGTNSNADVAQKYIDTANDPKTSPSEKNKNILAYEQLTGEAFPDSNGKKISDTNKPTTGIPLDKAEAPAVEKAQEDESKTETGRTDSTDSLKTVDLNESEVMQDAQNVKDSSGVTSFIKSMVDRLFGKDANNPEVQDAMDQAMSDAQAEQWWSPWDGSKFQRWYDNTMESFKQIKNSVSKSLSTKNNNAASDVLDGFTSVDLNDLEDNQEYSLFRDGRIVKH